MCIKTGSHFDPSTQKKHQRRMRSTTAYLFFTSFIALLHSASAIADQPLITDCKLVPKSKNFCLSNIGNETILQWFHGSAEDFDDIDLSSLNVSSIGTDVFKGHCKTIHNLSLAHNALSLDKVTMALIGVNLVNLDLSHNALSNGEVQQDWKPNEFFINTFSSYGSLYSLDLSNNNLTKFQASNLDIVHLNFSRNNMIYNGHLATTAWYLDLSHNRIEHQTEFFFKSLIALDLSHNSLLSLGPVLLKGQRELRTLKLHWNKVGFVHPKAFGDVRNLERLELQHNRIGELQVSFNLFEIKPLSYVDLSFNKLRIVHGEWFRSRFNDARVVVDVRNNSDDLALPLKTVYHEILTH